MPRALPASALLGLATLAAPAAAQPWFKAGETPTVAVGDLRPGMQGEVWTVFQGSAPEAFSVEFVGLIEAALGPGRDLILCRLTDPRVQGGGAAAGMSGSPLYFDGRLAGALSYTVQVFETEKHAGFTPIADILEVGALGDGARSPAYPAPRSTSFATGGAPHAAWSPVRPVVALAGVSPSLLDRIRPRLVAAGLDIDAAASLAGSSAASPASTATAPGATPAFMPGDSVSVALAYGDITLAGFGTVSYVDGDRLYAFGHPMQGLGEVAYPMGRAEVVTVAASTYRSFKLYNAREVVGTVLQDRLSAIYGRIGTRAPTVDVEVVLQPAAGETRPATTLRFSSVRDEAWTPLIAAIGVLQAIEGRNAFGRTGGFQVRRQLELPGHPPIVSTAVLSGEGSYIDPVFDLFLDLSWLALNPQARLYPDRISVELTPLAADPMSGLTQLRLDSAPVRAGQALQGVLSWQDYQGGWHSRPFSIPTRREWLGRSLSVVAAPGPQLDQLTGRTRGLGSSIAGGQLRTAAETVEALRGARPASGLVLAVVEDSRVLYDGPRHAAVPPSIARVATAADPLRYREEPLLEVLHEETILPDRAFRGASRETFQLVD